MMVRRPEEHHMSHRWRVSSLIDAFLELILALCIFLCAIMYVTTTRLIKSSGLFLHQTCVSCDVHHHHHHRQGGSRRDGAVEGIQKLDFCDLQRNRNHRDPSPMNISGEDCNLSLSNCACTVNRGYLVDNTAPRSGRCRYSVASVNSTLDCSAAHTVLGTDDYSCRNRCGGSCSSSENVDYSGDGSSERIVFDSTTTIAAYGCECRRCLGIGCHSPPYSKSRALKRKFAKVFPNDSRRDRSSSCCDHPACGLAESTPSTVSKGGPAEEIRESADDGLPLMHMERSSSRFLLDGSDGDRQHPGRFFPEDEVRDSSQESFSYRTRRSSPKFERCGAEVSRNRLRLSIDTDLLAGESSPEWCGSLASSCVAGKEMEMDDAGSTVHEDDAEIGVMELRDAHHEKQEALAALYLELEEERNAASSAAHEAMAMITRLQEEKAAIQMEARQYQRMAEEKQQYDHESMAILQEILVRRDEEVYALEEELNLCRTRLLTLGMDEQMDANVRATDRVGSSPKRCNDVLLIERQTLLLEGSEEWKCRRDRRDEKLLAEIKNWLHEANEKVAPERIEELNVPGNFQKISGNINRLLPGNGKKNLLESFSSVAIEDSQRDAGIEEFEAHRDGIVNEELGTHRETSAGYELFHGTMESLRQQPSLRDEEALETLKKIEEKFHSQSMKGDGIVNEVVEAHWDGIVNDELETHRETAAGYESFQGMMESLRQQPSLRDEESLKTLKKIEEKFHRQSSSKGEVRTGDELRQIWKNILKTFERDEREDAEVRGRGATELREQSPIIAVEPAGTSDSPDQNEVGNAADADRSIGEKRISVLEYVSKFEEQLHHLGNKKPPQAGKLSSTIEAVAEASLELVDSDKNRKPSFSPERPIPMKTRLRKLLSADDRNSVPDAERDRFVVRGEASPSSERATRTQDAKFEKSPDFEDGNQDLSSVVHDIYEVQKDTREPLTNLSSQGRKDNPVSHDIKKYVFSSVNDLVPGQFVDSHETARCVEHYLSDNGRQDFIAGHTLEEHEANGKGRQEQISSGKFRLSVKEEPADLWPGDCMDMSRGSGGWATDSPTTQRQDVVQQLTHRLKALETDRQMMRDTIASLKRENGQMKLLRDIAQQLGELRGMEQTAVTNKESWPSDDPAFVSSIKGMLSLDRLRHSVQSQLTKLVQLFLGNGNPGGYQGGLQAGLFGLLHKSPLSKRQQLIERARSLKALYAANSNPLDARSEPPRSTLDTLVSQHSWPMDAKDRAETAFSGWDY